LEVPEVHTAELKLPEKPHSCHTAAKNLAVGLHWKAEPKSEDLVYLTEYPSRKAFRVLHNLF
jgi:hypothetical protein